MDAFLIWVGYSIGTIALCTSVISMIQNNPVNAIYFILIAIFMFGATAINEFRGRVK